MSEIVHSHETFVHEKLVGRQTNLRVSTCETVLWEEFDKILVLAKAFAKINISAKALAGSGVWVLGG